MVIMLEVMLGMVAIYLAIGLIIFFWILHTEEQKVSSNEVLSFFLLSMLWGWVIGCSIITIIAINTFDRNANWDWD